MARRTFLFAALLIHAGVCLCEQRWWLAVALLLGAIVIKPLAIVMLMLAVFVYRSLIWRIALGVVVVAALPFLFGPYHYVGGQYQACWAHLRECTLVTENRFADMNGFFRAIGTPLGGGLSQIIRVLAGGLTLGALVVWRGPRARDRCAGFFSWRSPPRI